ncbi:Aldehyde dehydrogenase, conserved site-containing protein [Artemisia annua]|uniref:Aldehyde dehydrogenase, conserved site-containing protein n=1 Tax=Artemisia annua TaxID=35608 RepID=A0A2U1QNT3_ARTAN|nr:Aldehyde dehydrogenase, conserved site-containing protein [Artemisia annua]
MVLATRLKNYSTDGNDPLKPKGIYGLFAYLRFVKLSQGLFLGADGILLGAVIGCYSAAIQLSNCIFQHHLTDIWGCLNDVLIGAQQGASYVMAPPPVSYPLKDGAANPENQVPVRTHSRVMASGKDDIYLFVLKPSEISPAMTSLLANLFAEYLDNSALKVVNGGVVETAALLEQKWDKIFYTDIELILMIIDYTNGTADRPMKTLKVVVRLPRGFLDKQPRVVSPDH